MNLPYDSSYSICKAIYKKLGGTEEDFDSMYTILLKTLPLAGGGGSCPSYWNVEENVVIFPMTNDIYNSVFSNSPAEFISAYLWNCATDINLEYMDRKGTTAYNVHSNIMQGLLPVISSDKDYYQNMWSAYIQEDLSNPDFFIFVSGISPIDDMETLTSLYAMSDSEINWAIDAEKLPSDVVIYRDLKALAPDEFGKGIKTGEIPSPTEKPFHNDRWWRKEEEETKEQPTKS